MHKFVRMEVSRTNQKARRALRFSALIISLCFAKWVEVNPTVKIKPTIDKKYIEQNFTNPVENQQVRQSPVQPPPPPTPQQQQSEPLAASSMEAMMLEEMRYLRASMEHMQLQQSSNHRGIHRPGTSNFFMEGSGAVEPNYASGGSGVATDFAAEKALGAPFQNEDSDTNLDRVMKGD
ncbi:hypothetical protein VNO78_22012 [Psophocarpus tetragonolobus]|uniref:Uncharacterized protein n=1 Tax=Psophocarpus tetragonolobus TaxID=3891 RepID=A0AAN9XIN5_PSOTE